jgi:hypothetical protein
MCTSSASHASTSAGSKVLPSSRRLNCLTNVPSKILVSSAGDDTLTVSLIKTPAFVHFEFIGLFALFFNTKALSVHWHFIQCVFFARDQACELYITLMLGLLLLSSVSSADVRPISLNLR